MPDSELFGVAAAVLASASLVFLFLSLMRSKQPWLQALVVGLACWVISFPINVLILGQRPIEWALGGLVLLFSVSIGTRTGIYLRKRADLTSNDVE